MGGTREKLWGRQCLHTNRIYLLPTFYPSFTQVIFTFRISVTLNLPFNWSANWNGLQHTHTKNNCTALIQIDFLGCVSLLKSKSRFLIQQRIFRFFHKIQKRIIDPNDPQRRCILWIVSKTGYTIGVWKGRERGFWARGKREGRARREGGRETPARKPLFSPSRLLIMYAKITQLWMTSCQISLATMRLFKSYFAYCFSFVFLKQEIWSEGTIKKSIKCGRLLKEESRNHAWLVI